MYQAIKKIFAAIVVVVLCLPVFSYAADNMVASHAQAEFTNAAAGVLNLAPTTGGVTVSATGLTGDAWGNVTGWIRFEGGSGNTAHKVAMSCNPTTGIGTLSGYAWGASAGWVNFGPLSNAASVTLDQNGYMDGYAWSQNFGYLHFDKSACAANGGAGNNSVASPFTGGCVRTTYKCPLPVPDDKTDTPTGSYACQITASPNTLTDPGMVTLSWKVTSPSMVDMFEIAGDSAVYPKEGSTQKNITQTQMFIGRVTYNNGTVRECRTTVSVENERAGDTCNYFKQHLNLGDTGGEVKKLQDFLNQYMHAGLVVDGIYGKMTKHAVKNFQTLHFEDTITPWVTPVSKFSSRTTGRFYKTTMATANIIIGCPVDKEYLEDTKTTHSFGETSRRLLNSFKGFVRGLWQ